jgi:hypothetical protein
MTLTYVIIGAASLATFLAILPVGVTLWRRGMMRMTGDYVRRWVPCERCSGGAQALYEDGWGPIHKKDLIWNPSNSPYFEAPMANTRRCPNCQLGGNWKDIKVRWDWYRPPNMFVIAESKRRWRWPWQRWRKA